MFSCSDRIVIDPVDMEPVLVMNTTHQRKLRASLKRLVVCKVRRATKKPWYGIPMTYLVVYCPGGQADYDKILRFYPYQKVALKLPE